MILAGSPSQNGTPLIGTTSQSGGQVTTFGVRASSPTLEDMSEAQLVNGQASVQLDPTLASTIDRHAKYLVFVTPQGENRGLFVTQISSKGFVVRESAN